MSRDRLPALVFLALTLAVYAAGALVPYRLDTDTGFQLRSAQQWARGESPSPGTLLLPDPEDLGRDTLLWSNWWPPGFPFLYAPAIAAGLPLATALRLTSLLLFLAGSAGWLRIARGLELPRSVLLLFALSLAGYALTIGGAASLRTADLLAYAAGPWLALLVLRLAPRPAPLFFGGLALGASYAVRYSLFLAALAFAAFLAARAALPRDLPFRLRAGRLAALGLGFALPVLALFLWNLRQSESLTESATGTRSAWEVDGSSEVRPILLAVSLAGSPGLSLFQNDLWITHLTQFSDARIPWFRGLDAAGRLRAKALFGLPATVALLGGLVRALRRRPGPEGALAVTALAGFYLALLGLSVAVGYNYLGHEARLSAGFLPLVSLLAVAGWLPAPGRPLRSWERPLAAGLLALFFAAPLAFVAGSFARNDIADRLAVPYKASETGLFLPEISSRDVPAVEAALGSVLRSPEDLIVLSGPPGWGSAFLLWLEIPQRTLPVATFFAPLGARYLEAADLRGETPLVSSRPLRVVLVISKSLTGDGTLEKLQARFPQAKSWQSAPEPAHATVAIYFSDLEVP
ncbi:MAG TPA: hypothetical protein VJ725_00180 [Thermoanaerobaculia bacterium]|nr:hypothetical protein [Thermoanaerobaculia bacterium]